MQTTCMHSTVVETREGDEVCTMCGLVLGQVFVPERAPRTEDDPNSDDSDVDYSDYCNVH